MQLAAEKCLKTIKQTSILFILVKLQIKVFS